MQKLSLCNLSELKVFEAVMQKLSLCNLSNNSSKCFLCILGGTWVLLSQGIQNIGYWRQLAIFNI
ncbi:hypothetical protein Hanom_Chr10g00891711 [Helianthus anomalus]